MLQFMSGFSATAAPLHALPSSKVQFVWFPEAEAAFQPLKIHFTTPLILRMLDPQCQFINEVDVPSEGIGTVLSQRAESDGKMHPCAFLSRKLSKAKQNYDFGNRKLLAVKVALEEAPTPFIVWTDHKNLDTFAKPKALTLAWPSGHYSLIISPFLLSYEPGYQNIKPNALSGLYDMRREI